MLEYAAKFANIRIMKTIFKLLPVLCFAFMLCGCASLNVMYTPTNNVNTALLTKTPPQDIQIFVTSRPDYPYVELGTLTIRSGVMYADMATIYEQFRQKASQIGACAIIIMGTSTDIYTMPAVTYDYFGNAIFYDRVNQAYIYRAVAIAKNNAKINIK